MSLPASGKPDLEEKLKLASTIAAAVAALTMTATAGAHIIRPGCNSHLPARAELACARINYQHALALVAWASHQQKTVRFLNATTTFRLRHLENDHRWLARVMAGRIAEAQRRIAAASFPAHHQLWLCIHGGEGAWDDPNSGGNGHYGGLQMTPGWLGYFSGTANHYSQMQQERFAEQGYRDSGYSSAWLNGQWGQTIGPCWGYAR